MTPEITELRQQIASARESLRLMERQADALTLDFLRTKYGVREGDLVQTKKGLYRITRIELFCGDSIWLHGNPQTKDGEFSKAEQHVYGDWTKFEGKVAAKEACPIKCDELADRISAHLSRIEKDKKLNPSHPVYKTSSFYCANACRSGNRVGIIYVSHQGRSYLSPLAAWKYLQWLDAGNVGRHFEFETQST